MTSQELPSGGGVYERQADGTLKQVEAPTAPEAPAGTPAPSLAAGLEAPVEGAVERPAKSKLKET